ncbi:hypothetical protein [Dyella subtropica]|uniref:hypothetical protein n=1 Tax=Dyella subtropica TaxID=2992127 RepID=UPI002252CD9F|nr:hypothetical protein [Dyella subtropica]
MTNHQGGLRMGRFSDGYIVRLLAPADFQALLDLQGLLLSAPRCDPSHPTYALPLEAFTFLEVLSWFSQSIRSGSWTYFEVIGGPRSAAMLEALARFGPPGYVDKYRLGVEHWPDLTKMRGLDLWIASVEDDSNVWLRGFVKRHEPEIRSLIA